MIKQLLIAGCAVAAMTVSAHANELGSVPIYPGNGGRSALVDVSFGGYPARAILDTGATVSLISLKYAQAIVRDGKGRWLQNMKFTMANGKVETSKTILINEVKIGDYIVDNVIASVLPPGDNAEGDMLVGFALVNAIGPFTINTRVGKLIFDEEVAEPDTKTPEQNAKELVGFDLVHTYAECKDQAWKVWWNIMDPKKPEFANYAKGYCSKFNQS